MTLPDTSPLETLILERSENAHRVADFVRRYFLAVGKEIERRLPGLISHVGGDFGSFDYETTGRDLSVAERRSIEDLYWSVKSMLSVAKEAGFDNRFDRWSVHEADEIAEAVERGARIERRYGTGEWTIEGIDDVFDGELDAARSFLDREHAISPPMP